MANLRFTSHIWRPCWFSIFGGRWEYFTILFEILTDENVGIDTKTKSLDSLIRHIFVIEWFHLISMLIRSITQNAMDKKLFEILTVENVGIDTKTKYLESLIRKIFVIEWFHLISMLIRSITQNAMDTKFGIRHFPSPEHPYIAFPQKNLAVLDISRFTYRAIWNVSEILLCALGRSLGPKIVTLPRRHINTILHSSAHVADYSRITHTSPDRYVDDTCT